MTEYLTTAMLAYIELWREPISILLACFNPVYSWLMADLLFIWITIFLGFNMMTLIFDQETIWGHFNGKNEPIPAVIRSVFFFVFSPIIIFAGFVVPRWEVQDVGMQVLISWFLFLQALAILINFFM